MNSIYEPMIIDIILDNINNGVQAIDQTGALVFSNRIVAIQDDININESLGKHLLEVYPSLSMESSTLLQVLRTGQGIYDFKQVYTTYKGKEIHTLNTTLPIIVEGEIKGAVEISKDITDVKVLSEQVHILREKSIKEETGVLDDGARYTFSDIISHDPTMQRLKIKAMRAARSNMPLLVSGETGTGKELLVQSIHNASLKATGPFIAQNCAALPETLLESILFGTAKGSFTGAMNRQGLFEIANGGTLFLDEINSMPLSLQAKLLRVLQEGRIRRVGDDKTRKIDVRVIAATNMEGAEAVQQGILRQDLYYRLNTVSLEIPPLRARKDDIMLLSRYFIQELNDELYLQVKGVTKKVEQLFTSYPWPGNVRELEYVIKGAMHILDGKSIRMIDLPKTLLNQPNQQNFTLETENMALKHVLEDVERQMIVKAMKMTGNNISQSAELLEVPRQTLQYKLKKLRIHTS